LICFADGKNCELEWIAKDKVAVLWNDLDKLHSRSVLWDELKVHLPKPDFAPVLAAHFAELDKVTKGDRVADKQISTQIKQYIEG
jgi:hypothetical protein